jgi:hypothetical protein
MTAEGSSSSLAHSRGPGARAWIARGLAGRRELRSRGVERWREDLETLGQRGGEGEVAGSRNDSTISPRAPNWKVLETMSAGRWACAVSPTSSRQSSARGLHEGSRRVQRGGGEPDHMLIRARTDRLRATRRSMLRGARGMPRRRSRGPRPDRPTTIQRWR